jgi:hypothetical protein
VFVEMSWLDLGDEHIHELRSQGRMASEEILTSVKKAIEGVRDWGGWPDDKEVAEYCVEGTFTIGSSMYKKREISYRPTLQRE